jgi:hypothetical protein
VSRPVDSAILPAQRGALSFDGFVYAYAYPVAWRFS